MSRPPARSRRLTRALAVESMRLRLLRESFPRIQMFILVLLTGLAGFGASVAMLGAGIDGMALRYTLAMGVAYSVFLLLLWLWLHTSSSDYLEIVTTDGSNADRPDGTSEFAGGAGSFDGGGASGNYELAPEAGAMDTAVDPPLDILGNADDGAIPLAVICFALGIVLSSLFVIWSAPILFAEILVDALLAAGLYRRLRVLNPRHWMHAA